MMINIRKEAATEILSGANRGQDLFLRLLRYEVQIENPQPLFLDFKGVEIATASFLRESVVALRDVLRARRSHAYLVVANANAGVIDELAEVVRSRGGVLMTCLVGSDSKISKLKVLGSLDVKQQLTLDLVTEKGETDAGELSREFQAEDVKPTAWNNRLASLVSLGLIMEISQGRSKRYRPLLQGV
jgi:hypothetical protein